MFIVKSVRIIEVSILTIKKTKKITLYNVFSVHKYFLLFFNDPVYERKNVKLFDDKQFLNYQEKLFEIA